MIARTSAVMLVAVLVVIPACAADIGYLWNIHNDIAYQLDAI